MDKSKTKHDRSKVEKNKESMKKRTEVDELTENEMEVVTIVFHQYETGLREGTILVKDVLSAMKALGLNPAEQEMIDMTNEVAINGLVFFPDFCKLVARKYREEDKELLHQNFFKVKTSLNSFRC